MGHESNQMRLILTPHNDVSQKDESGVYIYIYKTTVSIKLTMIIE